MISNEIKHLVANTKFYEKIVLTIILLIPLSLTMSIFIADLFSVILSIFFFSLIFKKNPILSNVLYIKKPLIVILLFFFIVMVSLIFSNDFNKSFLPSFFYFRYFLMSLIIYVYICKYRYLINLIMFSLLLTFSLIFFDSFMELLEIKGLLNFELNEYKNRSEANYFITSFFNEEKKLGSYLIRLLPLVLSLIIYTKYRPFDKINFNNFIILTCGLIIIFTSERTALFLFVLTFIFLLKFIQNKKKLIMIVMTTFIITLITNPRIGEKYILVTLTQFNITKEYSFVNFFKSNSDINFSNLNYISEEHEKLILSGLEVFKENIVFGSGIKTYHEECNKIKKIKNLNIVCSTHPHNTYIQLLAAVGIFGTFVIIAIFFYILFFNIQIFLKKNPSRILISFYILNLGLIINLMPFIPSGSFFNNWICLMIHYPLGFWFFLSSEISKNGYQVNGK
jgi:O-antigen ligase